VNVVISGLGLVTPLADQPARLQAALAAGEIAVGPSDELSELPCDLAARAGRVDLKPWLQRRKDRKLLSRAAQLALPAAGRALGDWPGDREELGLFVGVGREPPDTGDSEASLAASARDGALCPQALASRGRELYPPLLPLLTLPNLLLSHISINLGIRGWNGTIAGEAAAGLGALVEGYHAVAEARCPAALTGAADSRVDFGSARDLIRLGHAGPARAPAEGAVFFLLQPERDAQRALARLEPVHRGPSPGPRSEPHHAHCGDLGAADGLLALAIALIEERWGEHTAQDHQGASVTVRLLPPAGRAS
jgi:hypothetical protein